MVVIGGGATTSFESLMNDLMRKDGQPPTPQTSIDAMLTVEIKGTDEIESLGAYNFYEKFMQIMKPRPVQAASIPAMLGMFQNEWDALVLSTFASEQKLHTTRQELIHCLYQHDSACRVIARLKKELDEARTMLSSLERQAPMPATTTVSSNAYAISNGKRAATEDDEFGPNGKKFCPGISSSIVTELTDCKASLSQQKKKRQVSWILKELEFKIPFHGLFDFCILTQLEFKIPLYGMFIPPTLVPLDAIERYTQLNSCPLHKTNKAGIFSIDIHQSKDLIATGGVDMNVVVFNRSLGEIVSTLSGHSKNITFGVPLSTESIKCFE
ncbi:unnamed protein product [Lactuca saligna]|uniref:Pre-mRNA-processing factor 19 n=1 Tax=Lactuca saligna TaxID=75948 RepID=A0AA35Y9U6_LACSI|nr:unnamed protein product [Lactuca saligna]